jgi:hypothetical protein
MAFKGSSSRNLYNCILMMDELEEQRPLHITEWNFRNIIKNKLFCVSKTCGKIDAQLDGPS